MTRDFEYLVYEKKDRVAIITMNRPEKHNALNMGLINELSRALADADEDDDVKVVLLRGAGKSFCSGADLNQFMEFAAGRGNPIELGVVLHYGVIKKMREMGKAVVAELKGYVIGAGLGLAMASDYAVAAESTTFSAGFTLVGLSPDTGTSFFIPRAASMKRAFEIMATARTFSAKEALEYGLVTEIVPDDELESRVEGVVNTLLNRPRVAIAHLKKLLNVTYSNGLDEHLGYELTLAMKSAISEDFIEGVTAMLEKREPKFR